MNFQSGSLGPERIIGQVGGKSTRTGSRPSTSRGPRVKETIAGLRKVPRPAYRDSTVCARRVEPASGFHHCSSQETAFAGNPVRSQRSSVSSSDTPPFHGLCGRSSVYSGLVVGAWSVDDCPYYFAYNTTRSVLFPGPVAPPGECPAANKGNRDEDGLVVRLLFRDVLASLRFAVSGADATPHIVRATKEEGCRLRHPNHLNKT